MTFEKIHYVTGSCDFCILLRNIFLGPLSMVTPAIKLIMYFHFNNKVIPRRKNEKW